MPPRNQSDGFTERNQHLGGHWSDLNPTHKDIYHEDIFYQLGYLACGWQLPPQEPGVVPLTDEAISKYLPIFKEIVNLEKVARDLGKGKFSPDLATANQNKGIQEVQRIDNEVSPLELL